MAGHNSTSLVRGALTDETGQGDIAYISLGALAVAVLGPVTIMTFMGVVAHLRCQPRVIEVTGKEPIVIACPYDPQPLGIAIGSACGGFALALGALAGYMAATRRPAGSSSLTTTRVKETVVVGNGGETDAS